MNEKHIRRIQFETEVIEQLSNAIFLLGIFAVIQRAFAEVFSLGIILLIIGVVGIMTGALIRRVRWQQFVERLAILGMIIGLVGMFQAWEINFYENGFYMLGISTLSFIIISHIPTPSTE